MGATLTVENNMVHPNEAIEVSFDLKDNEFTPGSCWIGLIPHDINSRDEVINDQHDVDYFHVNSKTGKCTLRTSKIGIYHIKCFANDNGGKHIDTFSKTIYVSYIKIKNNKSNFNENEQIEVLYNFESFNNKPECIEFGGNNWIGIIPSNIKSREENINDQYDTNYFRMQTKNGINSMTARRGSDENVNKFELRVFPRDNGGQQIGIGIPIIINKNVD